MTVDLSPVRITQLVAPVISRTFVAGMRAGGTEGRELVTSYGGRAVGYMIDLRNPLAAGRRLTPAGLASVYRYTDPAEVRDTVARSVEHGLLEQAADGSITASERGQAFLRDLYALHGRALGERWERSHAGQVERLDAALDRLLAAAEMAAMPWGSEWSPQRRKVEEETNRLAAPPYEVLTPDERLTFLADLATLP